MPITIDKFVDREIHFCASHLVAALATGSGFVDRSMADLSELCEQAMEACTPIPDWEEAAIQEGWRLLTDEEISGSHRPYQFGDYVNGSAIHTGGSWQDLCEAEGIEPYEREILEHWCVSDWLADKLEERGERIVRDMAGMTIWGRTTSGQGIAQDSVIQDIFADMVAA